MIPQFVTKGPMKQITKEKRNINFPLLKKHTFPIFIDSISKIKRSETIYRLPKETTTKTKMIKEKL